MVLVLFPSEPFSPREVDPEFEVEQNAARAAGFATALLDHTRVVEGDAAGAVGRVPENADAVLYRGWMLTPGQYAASHAALEARGTQLINSPEQYRTCHYLPEKHYWNEACFIPRASDRSAVERVVSRFLELQGQELAEGLVFREFVPLAIVGKHPQSGTDQIL